MSRQSRVALEAGGVQIVDLGDAERTAFRAAVRHLVEQQHAELPAGLAVLMQAAH